MFRSSFFVVGILLALSVPFVGCEIVGYGSTPSIGGSAWEVVETPAAGGMQTILRTRASANSFFGRAMSVFSRPSLSYVCGPDREWRVDWREAVGPPHESRRVSFSFDGDAPFTERALVSESGRVTAIDRSRGFVPAGARILTASVVNRRGDTVVLVFSVANYEPVRAGACDS